MTDCPDSYQIVHAGPEHAREVAPLFDHYRSWYGMSSDADGAHCFLQQRLTAHEAEVFFVRCDGQAVAFALLYPMFSSVSMAPIWILNDLYVDESSRRQGVGTLLLSAVADFARALGAVRLQLETRPDNQAAQSAYEQLGWEKDNQFLHYTLELSDPASA